MGPAVDQVLESVRTVTAEPEEVNCRVRLTVSFVAVPLVPSRVLPACVEQHSGAQLASHVDDELVDAVAQGFYGGIRLIDALDRDMVHVRLLGATRTVVRRRALALRTPVGVPNGPRDLARHDCIGGRWSRSGRAHARAFERGRKNGRVPVRGPVITIDFEPMRVLALAGVGLHSAVEPKVEAEITGGALRPVLESYAPAVPGRFLFYPSRAQVSPALRTTVGVAPSVMKPKLK